MKLFNKILVANRGEIAVRIMKSLRKMGMRSVAIYSSQDKNALHVRMADEAYDLGSNELKDTYLDIPKIINIAVQSGADAIHPGYGFLSENAEFSKAAADAGINFIGPTAEVISLMGNKVMARKTMREIGIPMIEGFEGSLKDILSRKNELSYPLLVKAAGGGGGKAMRIVHDASSLKEALEVTTREALNYFGNGILFVEHYLSNARHIEVQLLADHYGNVLIIGERECSIQRRYQKVIEESPAVSLSGEIRKKIYDSAMKIAEKIAYNNAGTLEFLVEPEGNYYFLEMNTRIQVEHPVTEMVTGLDIVELQVNIAAGNELELKQTDIKIAGHAIEARLYAEDPERDFLPSPGKIELYNEYQMPGLRIDSSVDGPDTLHPDYDPLIAKVIFHAPIREEAIDGLSLALKNFILHGPKNNREFVKEILADKDFRRNKLSTNYLDQHTEILNKRIDQDKISFNKIRIIAAWLGWKLYFNGQKEKGSVWSQIGCWRLLLHKSLILNTKQIDVLFHKVSTSAINFSIGHEQHEMVMKGSSNERIIFELDGIWSSASVSGGNSFEDIICIEGMEFKLRPLDFLPVEPWLTDHNETGLSGEHLLKSPLHGKVSRINVSVGENVKKGDLIYSLDAMKIENKVTCPFDGVVKEIKANAGDQVAINQIIIIIES